MSSNKKGKEPEKKSKGLRDGSESNPSLKFRNSKSTGFYITHIDDVTAIMHMTVNGSKCASISNEDVEFMGNISCRGASIVTNKDGKRIYYVKRMDAGEMQVTDKELKAAENNPDVTKRTLISLRHVEVGSYIMKISGIVRYENGRFHYINIHRFITFNEQGVSYEKLQTDTITSSYSEDVDGFTYNLQFRMNNKKISFNMKISIRPLDILPDIKYPANPDSDDEDSYDDVSGEEEDIEDDASE
jgi:hypothetical protein